MFSLLTASIGNALICFPSTLLLVHTVFIRTDVRGTLENFRDYVGRMESGGDDPLVDGLKAVAESCPPGEPEDKTRDTSKDICVFPACPAMASLVANVLVGSTRGER